jgi:hypothetical protein
MKIPVIENPENMSAGWMNLAERTFSEYDFKGDYSATDLLLSPRQFRLKKRHTPKIKLSRMADSMAGWALHKCLQTSINDIDKFVAEKRMYIKWSPAEGLRPVTIGAKPDLMVKDGKDWTLINYKSTKAYAAMRIKDEWEQQTNTEAYVARLNGYNVTSIWVEVYVRDWAHHERMQNPNYPSSPLTRVPYPVWSEKKTLDLISQKVILLESHRMTPDEQLPDCTHEERWAKNDTWAVIRQGSTRAMSGGVKNSQAAAEALALEQKVPCKIEFRQGESPRCHMYCDSREVCSQFQERIKPHSKIYT